jgi:hypothetical protein
MKKNINVRRASALRIRQKNLEFWKKLVINPSYTDSTEFERIKSEKIKLATKEIAILKERVTNG